MNRQVKCWKCETLGVEGQTCQGCMGLVREYPPAERRRNKPPSNVYIPQRVAQTEVSVPLGTEVADSDLAPRRDLSLETLKEIAENTRQTKHAVRAFVRFLFIQLSFTTLAIPLYNLSLAEVNTAACMVSDRGCEPNPFLLVPAVILWLAGVLLSSQAGWSELRKSD